MDAIKYEAIKTNEPRYEGRKWEEQKAGGH